jgi:type III restriction enzyme
VRIDDGRGDDDLLNLVVEIRVTGAKTPRTRRTRWTPIGVNNLGTYGRWAFVEFKESVYAIAANFDAVIAPLSPSALKSRTSLAAFEVR